MARGKIKCGSAEHFSEPDSATVDSSPASQPRPAGDGHDTFYITRAAVESLKQECATSGNTSIYKWTTIGSRVLLCVAVLRKSNTSVLREYDTAFTARKIL